MNLSLKNKNAIVCGSTQGIGKAAAVELALAGANCILVARDEEKLKAAVKELDTSQGQKHSYIAADFSIPEELKIKIEKYIGETEKNISILTKAAQDEEPLVREHAQWAIKNLTKENASGNKTLPRNDITV